MEESIIARSIRKIRTDKELTLEEVARRTGFTKGLLSKVENNKVSPPVSTLVKIARALDVSLGDLFSPSDSQQLKVIRRNERIRLTSENSPDAQVVETLVSGFHRQKIEPLIVTIENGGDYKARLYNHPGQEFILVLEGSTNYTYGSRELSVSEGDSLYFNADTPHGPSPLPGQKVKYLSVICP